jgi:opacity protein-like surface antigen
MKKFAMMAAVAAAAMLAMPGVASAQNVYANLGYTQYDFDGAEVGGVTGRLGYNFNQNFGVEGEAPIGVDDDAGVDLDNSVGAFAVGRSPLGNTFGEHGRVGYQNVDLDTPGIGIRADYTRFEGDLDSDGVSLGATMNF